MEYERTTQSISLSEVDKEETLKEASERLNPVIIRSTTFGSKFEWVPKRDRKKFILGAKWQQEQDKNKYSEEEVLNFTQTVIQQYKFGNTNIEQLDLLKERFTKQFKNK